MRFIASSRYNTKSLAMLNKALRKAWHNKLLAVLHGILWLFVASALLLFVLSLLFGLADSAAVWRNGVTALLLLLFLTMEDRIFGFLTKRALLPGTETAVTEFLTDEYITTTGAGKTQWKYSAVQCIAETSDAFFFILGKRSGQVYEKTSLQGGTVEEFRHFLEETTGKTIRTI